LPTFQLHIRGDFAPHGCIWLKFNHLRAIDKNGPLGIYPAVPVEVFGCPDANGFRFPGVNIDGIAGAGKPLPG
jgi:hypothetical protein